MTKQDDQETEVMQNTWRILVGDVREQLASLPDASVQCCVTSPPYWGLRDYGHAGQIGLEPTLDAYVAAMVDVFQCVWRVLKDDGVVWLNLGDSYATGGAGRRGSMKSTVGRHAGVKSKDLFGIPWRVAFALQAKGWYLRSDVIWSKPNPMPESVTDRPTRSHEYVFLLSKTKRYFYCAEAIKEPSVMRPQRRLTPRSASAKFHGQPAHRRPEGGANPVDRNARSVWPITTRSYPKAHFATFPEALPERCIRAGSRLGDTVLDPFAGSGTTGAVAIRLGRGFVGCELNPVYAELARERISGIVGTVVSL